MTATPETTTLPAVQPSPRTYLTAMFHSIVHAIELTKAGNLLEASEHVDAVERLASGYHAEMGEPQRGKPRDVKPIPDSFPAGQAANRLKQALEEFRSSQAENTLADDLQTVLDFLEFTRDDIAHLRKSWAAITWCLMEQARFRRLTDDHLKDVPTSHQALLLGRDAMHRELLAVVAERDALKKQEG